MSDVDAVIRRLYGLRPEEFTAARDEAAPGLAGADRTRVKKLRKPTLAAWAVNRVARERPDVVEALADLGDRMRDAQADGDGAALRELEKERRAASRTAVAAAVQVTGLAASAGAMEGVTASLRAVALDPDAAQAVLAGCLDRPLEASGFGATGIAPTRRAAPRRSTTDRLAAAREAVTEATEALDRARTELDAAQVEHESALAARDAAVARREDLERELEQARADEDAALARTRTTQQAVRAAAEDEDAASLAAAAAERDVAALEKQADR